MSRGNNEWARRMRTPLRKEFTVNVTPRPSPLHLARQDATIAALEAAISENKKRDDERAWDAKMQVALECF